MIEATPQHLLDCAALMYDDLLKRPDFVLELKRRTLNDLTPALHEDETLFYRFSKGKAYHLSYQSTVIITNPEVATGDRGGPVVRSRLRDWRASDSKSDASPVLLNLSSKVSSPDGEVRKLGDGVPPQLLSSSSDYGSTRRGPSQNYPRMASKWGVNIIELII
ncbi:hypothetical protein AVEN_20714-1 [Araneus ventricosus]|uniref:Uncharacterized protein n=1 Tax=Araneus ventricosus TaxID=182803 RepID=A0A4Y2RQU4_ARAVE|nr:hypothetical protein AVEN_20714-1 [Araneus ventricosus]